MYKRFNEIAKALSYFTEVALTAIVPIAIWIAVAQFVKEKFALGSYVTLIGTILGIITSYSALFRLFKRISAESSKKNSSDTKE